MNLSDTFHRHAEECQRMAASAPNPVDKATWSQMAKRCLACAEHYETTKPRSIGSPRPQSKDTSTLGSDPR